MTVLYMLENKTRKTYIFGKMNIISEKITMKKYVNSGVGKFLQ